MGTLLIAVFVLLGLALWIWAIVDIVRSIFENPAKKNLWLLIVVLFPVLGSLLYFQLGRKDIEKEKRRFQPDFNRAE